MSARASRGGVVDVAGGGVGFGDHHRGAVCAGLVVQAGHVDVGQAEDGGDFEGPYVSAALVLEEERANAKRPTLKPNLQVSAGGLRLRPRDKVVVTGAMVRARADIVEHVTMLGLRITDSVSRQTRVVAAADPDSLSGKAKRARDIGVPVVDEHTFFRALDQLAELPARS